MGRTGLRVAITRSETQARAVALRVAEHGGELRARPTTSIEAPDDDADLRRAAAELARYDWLVFTSFEGARALARHCPPPWPATVRVAVVGERSAAKLEALGIAVDLVPDEQNAAGLLRELADRVGGKRILVPQSAIALGTLPAGLSAAGAVVDAVVAYQTVPDPRAAARLLAEIRDGTVDILIVTSPSSFRALRDAGGTDCAETLRKLQIVALGPTTSEAMRALGREPDAEARSPDPDGVLEAVLMLRSRFGGETR